MAEPKNKPLCPIDPPFPVCPVSKLRTRLVNMAAELGITVVAVDPACTSRWGAQHWQKPLTSKTRKTTRHDAAGIATEPVQLMLSLQERLHASHPLVRR
jgi:hypothetical protein